MFSSQGIQSLEDGIPVRGFHRVGADGGGGTPVPIPNTAVKPTCAQDTWLEAARENRQVPTPIFAARMDSFLNLCGLLLFCSRSFPALPSGRFEVLSSRPYLFSPFPKTAFKSMWCSSGSLTPINMLPFICISHRLLQMNWLFRFLPCDEQCLKTSAPLQSNESPEIVMTTQSPGIY